MHRRQTQIRQRGHQARNRCRIQHLEQGVATRSEAPVDASPKLAQAVDQGRIDHP